MEGEKLDILKAHDRNRKHAATSFGKIQGERPLSGGAMSGVTGSTPNTITHPRRPKSSVLNMTNKVCITQ